jgi:hypothetical protein
LVEFFLEDFQENFQQFLSASEGVGEVM